MADGYFVRIRGKVSGPFGVEALQRMVQMGSLSRVHEISVDRSTWVRASEYQELFPVAATSAAAVSEVAYASEPIAIAPEPEPEPAPLLPAWNYPPPQPSYEVAPPQHIGYASPPGYYAPPAPSGVARHTGQSYSGMATASMVLSLVGLFCFGFVTGVLAIIFAGVALSGMGRSGNTSGKGMAITGLVIGLIDIVGWVMWLALWAGAAHAGL